VLDFGLYEEQPIATVEAMLQTNLVAPMLLCRQMLPLLKARPEAALVMLGSIFGSIGHPGFVAYCAGKFGLRGFTEALARELADTPVQVLYLAPRATRTALNPERVNDLNAALGNSVDDPGEVARALVELLERGSRRRYLGWPEKLFVRINALLPGIVDRALAGKLDTVRHFATRPRSSIHE
jgi:short-subunit dehydrogenase